MGFRARINDPLPARGVVLWPRGKEEREKKIRKQERTQMIRSKLQLDTFRAHFPFRDIDARIIEQNVQTPPPISLHNLVYPRSSFPYGPETRQVDYYFPYLHGRVGGVYPRHDFLDLAQGPGSQDQKRRILGG